VSLGRKSPDEVQALRLRAQRLSGRVKGGVARVVGGAFAIQAQDEQAASIGIWARSDGLALADVAQARDVERSVVRLWCLRGTLHLVSAEDARWLVDLLRPRFVRANQARRKQLGLDDELTARGVRVVVQLLNECGPLTRSAIAEGLAAKGIPAAGQATIHVVWRAALDGLVCYGPERAGEATFVLLDDWLPQAPAAADRASHLGLLPAVADRSAQLRTLTQRYLAAHGPARPEDLVAWSGLSLREARQGWAALADELVELQTASGPMWLLKSADAESPRPTGVRLLPAFDGLWLGYRDGYAGLSAAQRRRIYPGGGIIRPTVLVDGRPVGTWARHSRGAHLEIVVNAFAPLSATATDELEARVKDLGRFLGRAATLTSTATGA